MTLGALVAFTFLMGNFMNPVNQLVSVGNMLHETESDMGRIDDVMNYEPDNQFLHVESNELMTNSEKIGGRF